jgi:hypothetical protein
MAYYSKKPRAIGDLLKDFVETYPARKKLKRGMVLSVLPSVFGERIMEQISGYSLEGGRLIINVRNQAWKQELHFQRSRLRDRLNREVKEEIVEEILVR